MAQLSRLSVYCSASTHGTEPSSALGQVVQQTPLWLHRHCPQGTFIPLGDSPCFRHLMGRLLTSKDYELRVHRHLKTPKWLRICTHGPLYQLVKEQDGKTVGSQRPSEAQVSAAASVQHCSFRSGHTPRPLRPQDSVHTRPFSLKSACFTQEFSHVMRVGGLRRDIKAELRWQLEHEVGLGPQVISSTAFPGELEPHGP